jgi:hypothetical protein
VSHIHFIGGEKGGVGKSVVARVLAQWLIDRSLTFAGVDGDPPYGGLLRHYGEFTQAVDLTAPDSADQIIDRALGADRRVVVDLPAQSVRSLQAWMLGANVLEFAREMGIGITFWQVTDGGFASVGEIDRGLSLLRDQVQHVVVKNAGRSKDFSQFDKSSAKQKLDELSGKVIELPELDASVMYKVDGSGLSFWAAIHQSEGEAALKPLDRQRVKLWLGRCYTEFDVLAGAL